MLKFLSSIKSAIFRSNRPEIEDAKRIYAKVMSQSRNPGFYTKELVADSTDGRMEWLSAHLSVVLHVLRNNHGLDGVTLSQAIYDIMVDDFDIALREEGLSDSGVKHRIKPLAKMFLTRARSFSDVLENRKKLSALVAKHVLHDESGATPQSDKLAKYLVELKKAIEPLDLDQIAAADFNFPECPS